MKKIKTLGTILIVVLSVIILTVIIFFSVFGNKQLLTSLTQRESQREIVFKEITIELKGVVDSRKIVYETDNAIIKISYDVAKEDFLQEIKYYQNAIREADLILSKEYYENVAKGKIRSESIVKKEEEFINWLESQNDKNEINISNSPYADFLKNTSIETLISIQIKKGEAEVYDKSSKKNVAFIKLKVIYSGSFTIYRYYLPDGKLFFVS